LPDQDLVDDMQTTVRKLGPEDAPAAQALVRAFHESAVSRVYLSGLLSNPTNLLLVAEAGGEAVGFVWAHWLGRLTEERERLFLYEIEVAPEHRRRGVGTQLMHAVLLEARSRGSVVFLLTNRSNAEAVSFYKQLGGTVKNGDDVLFVYPSDGAA
jgi:aminoglycoside 3-N-acetyltransferase I